MLRTENIEKRPESPKPDLNEFKNEIVGGLTEVCNNFSGKSTLNFFKFSLKL